MLHASIRNEAPESTAAFQSKHISIADMQEIHAALDFYHRYKVIFLVFAGLSKV